MIILRTKIFSSTKNSREKSREANKKDKTRKALNAAQGVTAVAGLGTALVTDKKTKEAVNKVKEMAKKKGVAYGNGVIMQTQHITPKNKNSFEAVRRLDKRIAKKNKRGNIAALGLAGSSIVLGGIKHGRDIKKSKNNKKEE